MSAGDGAGKQRHIPVLAAEVLEYLVPAAGPSRIVDGTLGYGGHSALMLGKNPEVRLLGVDRDDDALAYAREVLAFAGDRATLVKGDFSDMAARAAEAGWRSADAVLLDIGISSPQIDEARRGFAHRFDGPLDMRMDQRRPLTAGRILNNSPFEELVRIFREYGEVEGAASLARAVVARRAERPWLYTSELAELCERVLPRPRRGGLPSPTLCFQALRVAVNDELGELERALEAAAGLLAPGGRMAVISYHSLEDRLVKNFFRTEAATCLCPPGLPICICGHQPRLKLVTRKPVTPGDEELAVNRRSKSAKMRVAEKL